MKERPILFSTEMVKAITEGRKTMTRRVVKPQPESKFCNGEWYADRYNHTEDWCFWGKRDTDVFNKCGLPLFQCHYGQEGDRLWVRETFCYKRDPITAIISGNEFWYKATNPEVIKTDGDGFPEETKAGYMASPWLPSIHMPRKASRINLEITNIRVERVQDITEADAIEEGIRPFSPNGIAVSSTIPHQRFYTLWNSINAKRGYSWEVNPYVWVIEFKREISK